MNVVVVLRTSFRPRVAAGEVRHECDSSQASHRRSHPRRQRFNLRPDAAVAPREFRFPERHISSWLPKVGHRRLYEEHFALSEEDTVRGCYIFKYQSARATRGSRNVRSRRSRR
jgi:hypothetical protein